jgi:hypothetical protein
MSKGCKDIKDVNSVNRGDWDAKDHDNIRSSDKHKGESDGGCWDDIGDTKK